nr:MAG TPA: hypothetical protein [Caudoviricetes sp.]
MFLLKYIYILHICCFVGRCWTCWIYCFQPSNIENLAPSNKIGVCWTCWTSSNTNFSWANLRN